jgi:hypothetical protein
MKAIGRFAKQQPCQIEPLEVRRLLAVLFSDDFAGVFAGESVVSVHGSSSDNLPAFIFFGSGQKIWTNPFGDFSRNLSIDAAAEVDIFALHPAVSGPYVIATTGSLDTQFRLYDSGGQPITPVIDQVVGGETITETLSQGNQYYIAIAASTASTGFYTLNINGPDAPVSNLQVAGTVNSAIDSNGKVEYFSLTVPAADKLKLTVSSGSLNSYMELYDSAGNLLQAVNAGGVGAQEVILYSSTPGQPYYIAVTDDSIFRIGSYTLQVEFHFLAGNFPEAVVPGTGQRIWTNPLGRVSRNTVISAPSEVDLFAFTPAISGSYTISAQATFDAEMRIYDSSGQPITPLINETSVGEATTRNLLQGQWYYIGIDGYISATGNYTLDINGPNPSIVNVQGSTTVNSAIDWGGDVDYFSLIAPEGTDRLTLTTSASIDGYVELYDPTGFLLQFANATGPGVPEVLTFFTLPGRTYYVAVADASRTSVSAYSLGFDFHIDPGDPPLGITPSSSILIRPNHLGDVNISGNIPSQFKYDLYAFMPDVTGSHLFIATGALDTQFRVYGSNGFAISNIIDSAPAGGTETLNISLPGRNWYYVAVGGRGPSTGNYTLSIGGPDSNTTAIATPLPTSTGSANETLSFGGQRKFYALTTPSNSLAAYLSLTLTPLQAADTYLELYNASGALIASSNTGGVGAADVLSKVPVNAGTYIVSVSGLLPTTTTTFRLDADFDPSDHSVIHGRTFVDRNTNGVADAGEPAIPGWMVYLDLDYDGQYDPGEPVRIPDANGEYVFDELGAGSYDVGQVSESSWVQISPGPPQAQNSPKAPNQYVLDGRKWPQSGPNANVTITYSYGNLLDGGLLGGLSVAQIRAAIQEALALWANYAPLNFVEVPDVGPPISDEGYTVDGAADIRFGYHFIDGVSGFLAHAMTPPPFSLGGNIAGDVHFDAADTWGLNAVGNVIDIIEVAVHEIGHALGLLHDPVAPAIMYFAYGNHYNGLGTAFLFPDDIAGIQAIYGTRVARPGMWRITVGQQQTSENVSFGYFPTSFAGSDGDDTFVIHLDPNDQSRLRIEHTIGAGPQVSYSIDKTLIKQIHYDALGGNDTLVIDSSAGDPRPPDGFIFNLGTGIDALVLKSGQHRFEADVAGFGVDAVTVSDGASLALVGPQHLSDALTLINGTAIFDGPILSVDRLLIQNASWLDLHRNPLIVKHGDLASVTSDIRDNRIRTSFQLANRRLGAIRNINPIRTTFAGETGLVGNEILVLYTLIGDLNLDKSVSISDLIDLSSNFDNPGTWRDGDVNYDGLITIDDFIELVSNFNLSFAGASQPIAAPAPQSASATSMTRHPKKYHQHHQRKAPMYRQRPHLAIFR